MATTPKKSLKPMLDDSFSAQIRGIIRSRTETPHALARRAGVDVAGLSRFLSGERGLTTPCVDRLFAALGLRLVEGSRKRPPAASAVLPIPSGASSGGDRVVDLNQGALDVQSASGSLLEAS